METQRTKLPAELHAIIKGNNLLAMMPSPKTLVKNTAATSCPLSSISCFGTAATYARLTKRKRTETMMTEI